MRRKRCYIVHDCITVWIYVLSFETEITLSYDPTDFANLQTLRVPVIRVLASVRWHASSRSRPYWTRQHCSNYPQEWELTARSTTLSILWNSSTGVSRGTRSSSSTSRRGYTASRGSSSQSRRWVSASITIAWLFGRQTWCIDSERADANRSTKGLGSVVEDGISVTHEEWPVGVHRQTTKLGEGIAIGRVVESTLATSSWVNVGVDSEPDLAARDGCTSHFTACVRGLPCGCHGKARPHWDSESIPVALNANICACVAEKSKAGAVTIFHTGVIHDDRSGRSWAKNAMCDSVSCGIEISGDGYSVECKSIVDAVLRGIWVVVPFPLNADCCSGKGVCAGVWLEWSRCCWEAVTWAPSTINKSQRREAIGAPKISLAYVCHKRSENFTMWLVQALEHVHQDKHQWTPCNTMNQTEFVQDHLDEEHHLQR